ncbi:hypothetical protein ZWY2020_024725 [Hordeum vulgare]|nr:hypothetical protein ZWY2020_024725 [Hordeum vulgare]
MEQGLDAAAATHGHVVEGAETTTDVIQEVAIVGGAGDAARVVAGLVATAADLEEKAMAGYDSAMPDLDGDKQVVDVVVRRRTDEHGTGIEDMVQDFDDARDSEDEMEEYAKAFYEMLESSKHDMEDGNKGSFIEKEPQKIREKGNVAYYKRGKFICPYCTTKPKPKDGLYEHLMSHTRGLSTSADDINIRTEHAALLKALGPI